MPNYVITGVLGAGKTLIAVSKIEDYILAGRKVATNLDIYPEHLGIGDQSKASIIRVPDKPRACDLDAIGRGHDLEKPSDKHNGILVLDELATWLNSREWRDKERQDLINWLLHARKKRWDIYFLVQDAEALDAQVRKSLFDHTVTCSRMDRIKVLGISPPKIHVAHIYYGQGTTGMSVGKWVYRGTGLYQAYDTEQEFAADEDYIDGEFVDMRAPYTLLPPFYTKGRYLGEPVKKKPAVASLSGKVAKLPFYVAYGLARVFPALRPCFGMAPLISN